MVVTLAALMHLFKQKGYTQIISIFNSSEVYKSIPQYLNIFFESALALNDHQNSQLLFDISYKFVDTKYDRETLILCNILVYLFLPSTINRNQKIKMVRDKIQSKELRLLFDHRVKIFQSTLNYNIREYCHLQKQSYEFCLHIANSENHLKYTALFMQVFRTSLLYRRSNLVETNKILHKIPYTNDNRYDVILSCTKDYFLLFAGSIYELLAQNDKLHVHLVIISVGASTLSTTNSCKVVPRLNVYRKNISANNTNYESAIHSTIARYEYLWPIMKKVKNDLLVLDIDLSFNHLDVISLIDNTKRQQSFMQNFLLTYGSLTTDYQSNISAGMLFASLYHSSMYEQISISLENLPRDSYQWGIDQSILIQALAENNLQPSNINYLSTMSPQHPFWSIDCELQFLKNNMRLNQVQAVNLDLL